VIAEGEEVVCVLTGHVLKDPDVVVKDPSVIERQIVELDADPRAVEKAIARMRE
jgi:threonine synthase